MAIQGPGCSRTPDILKKKHILNDEIDLHYLPATKFKTDLMTPSMLRYSNWENLPTREIPEVSI